MEKQAIGRAVRQGMNSKCTKVARFVVVNSIEYDTYKRNMEIRNKLIEKMKKGCRDMNEVNMKCQLINCLKVKRTESQIDFYMNINGEIHGNVKGKENVNCLNVKCEKRKMSDEPC